MKEVMKKAISYTAVFVTGVVACALALETLGDPAHFLDGQDAHAKQAVLASLSTIPPVRPIQANNPIATVAAEVEPSVVTIHTVGKATDAGDQSQQPPQQPDNPFFQDPFFRQFFGNPAPPQNPSSGVVEGAASGVILSSDGYILTNNHVVANTTSITVNVNHKAYDAHLIGTDPVTDIAVIKINPDGARLVPAVLGNSQNVRVGDWAIAVGNPLDIGTSVTLGIISAVSRTGLEAGDQPLQSVIQTDAAINPGNSGGALADINGHVIGINEAIESPTGYYSGIGFAIPINSARKIAEQLIESGKVVHPYIGISYAPLSEVSPNERAHEGITVKGDDGVVISGVAPRSPANQAGLEPGDVILEVNGAPLTSQDDLNQIILNHNVGDTLSLLISRDGQNMTINVTLRQRPADYGVQAAQPDQSGPDNQGQGQQVIPFP
jgi:serine protease Do